MPRWLPLPSRQPPSLTLSYGHRARWLPIHTKWCTIYVTTNRRRSLVDIALAAALAFTWAAIAWLAWDILSPLFQRDVGARKARRTLQYRRDKMR